MLLVIITHIMADFARVKRLTLLALQPTFALVVPTSFHLLLGLLLNHICLLFLKLLLDRLLGRVHRFSFITTVVVNLRWCLQDRLGILTFIFGYFLSAIRMD